MKETELVLRTANDVSPRHPEITESWNPKKWIPNGFQFFYQICFTCFITGSPAGF
jgi:hypothetical protein